VLKIYSPEDLKKMKLDELQRAARQYQLIGYSQLRKADLLDRLVKHMELLEHERLEHERAQGVRDAKGGRRTAPLGAVPARAEATSGGKAAEAARPQAPAPAPLAEMRDAAWYPPELPGAYGIDRLTLMVRDPHWLFCYWELNEALVAAARAEFDGPCWKVLRIHLLGEDESVLDGWEHSLPDSARSWYVHTGRPGALFRAELGLVDAQGRYRRLLASNIVRAPVDSPSERWDEEWIGLSRETWERLERFARPFPGSLAGVDFLRREMKALAALRLGAAESSAAWSAPSSHTNSSKSKKAPER